MDPLSITASIAAILQLASSVVSYLTSVKDASDDRRRLIAELGSITGLLYLLRDSANNSITALRSLSTPDGPLKQLTDSLNELASKLRPASMGPSKAGRSLLWPFHKSEINSILARIERFKTLLCLALQNDNNQLNHQMAIDLGGMRASLGYVQDTIKEMGQSAAGKQFLARGVKQLKLSLLGCPWGSYLIAFTDEYIMDCPSIHCPKVGCDPIRLFHAAFSGKAHHQLQVNLRLLSRWLIEPQNKNVKEFWIGFHL